MLPSAGHRRRDTVWRWTTDRWNRTPGYVKWIGGIVLGALGRYLFAHLFPQRWERLEHRLVTPTMPIWLALVILVAILVGERIVPPLYRRMRARREGGRRLRPLFGVRWATPPDVAQVQGPYCASCPTRLRGVMWSGDASPTLWICPSCAREFRTPEFADIVGEAARQLGATP